MFLTNQRPENLFSKQLTRTPKILTNQRREYLFTEQTNQPIRKKIVKIEKKSSLTLQELHLIWRLLHLCPCLIFLPSTYLWCFQANPWFLAVQDFWQGPEKQIENSRESLFNIPSSAWFGNENSILVMCCRIFTVTQVYEIYPKLKHVSITLFKIMFMLNFSFTNCKN